MMILINDVNRLTLMRALASARVCVRARGKKLEPTRVVAAAIRKLLEEQDFKSLLNPAVPPV